MKLNIHGSGCEFLIDYLTNNGVKRSDEDRVQLLAELFEEREFSKWVDAYMPMITGARSRLHEMMMDLDRTVEGEDPRGFFEKQRLGFLQAKKQGYDNMMRRLEVAKSIPKTELEDLVNRYLPEETPLEIDVFLTIDNFNQGMFRGNSIFVSILRFEPGKFKVRGMAHEIHHVGVLYWFKRNEKWVKWISDEEGPRRIGAELLIYLIGEGIANRLISPTAVSVVDEPENDRDRRHNERVKMLEGRYPQLVASIDDMLLMALKGSLKESRRLYSGFSIDESGVGLPTGHFTSAKMFSEILAENDESIVLELIKDPWMFFATYNGLRRKYHKFSHEIINFYSGP